MSHVIPRLSPFGRSLIVDRVAAGRPVAHVAAELGVSRQTAYRWIRRYAAEGDAGLSDRSSRPHSSPSKTSAQREATVVAARKELRHGPLRIGAVTGVAPRTVSRILARHGIPPLSWCDPVTGESIRASRATNHRYEWPTPGAMIHIDSKKIGRIPPDGGHRVHGRQAGSLARDRKNGPGYDHIFSIVDDHTRLAYSEVLPDDKGITAAGFLLRAANYFAGQGITRIERILSDNAFAYRLSKEFAAAVASLNATHWFIRPYSPWQNGKVERFNRTLATEWLYRRAYTDNAERAADLAPFIEHYNTERIHTAHGTTPAARVSPTS